MVEQNKNNKNTIREITYRVLKASLKAILIYVIYVLVTPMLAPLTEMVPDLISSIESFMLIFVVLMFLSDLTQDTIFQYFFNTARQIYIIGYLLLSMGDGVMSLSYDNLSLTVNLTIFYGIAVLLSLLGLARSILQAIDYMGKKTENELNFQPIQKI
jgi:uncharacterized protein YggT (Ycf19 family)